MRWPWQGKVSDEQRGLEEAERQLEEVEGQWPEVRRAAERMHEHRRRNNFAESIASLYRSNP